MEVNLSSEDVFPHNLTEEGLTRGLSEKTVKQETEFQPLFNTCQENLKDIRELNNRAGNPASNREQNESMVLARVLARRLSTNLGASLVEVTSTIPLENNEDYGSGIDSEDDCIIISD